MTPEEMLPLYGRLARETVEACTFYKQADYLGQRKEYPLLLPSGDNKYDSFWVRDCAMMCMSGIVNAERVRLYLDIFLTHGYSASDLRLSGGLTVPAGAMADHINYNGRPVFFPGTYADGPDQGDGEYGFYPPFCDGFYVVCLAGYYVGATGDCGWQEESAGAFKKADILERLYECYSTDETGLCVSDGSAYTVDWGFCDTVVKTGKLLFPSVLRFKSALALEKIFRKDERKSRYYRVQAEKIAKNIDSTFFSDGWLLSATGICRQPDVWGTAFAVYEGVLSEEHAAACSRSLLRAYRDKTAVTDGYVRHILTADAQGRGFWEKAHVRENEYQNGGWWGTPVGWYAYALSKTDKAAAAELLEDYLTEYLRFKEAGAPFEWISADKSRLEGKRYGTSAACPYEAILRIAEK